MLKKILTRIAFKAIGLLLLVFLNLDSTVLAESFENLSQKSETNSDDSWWDWFYKHKIKIIVITSVGVLILYYFLNGNHEVSISPADTPNVDTPKVDTPKVDTPKVDTPKVDTPKVDTPKVDTPKVDTPSSAPSIVYYSQLTTDDISLIKIYIPQNEFHYIIHSLSTIELEVLRNDENFSKIFLNNRILSKCTNVENYQYFMNIIQTELKRMK